MYDALTGAVVGPAQRPEHKVRVASAAVVPKPSSPKHSVLPVHGSYSSHAAMDGFVRHPNHVASASKVSEAPTKAKHNPHTHIVAHQPQPTKTLMRRAVKAPNLANTAGITQPKSTHALTSQTLKTPKIRTIAPLQAHHRSAARPKLASTAVDPFRARRAVAANRSNLVQHFTPVAAAGTVIAPAQIHPAQPTASNAPVAPPPAPIIPKSVPAATSPSAPLTQAPQRPVQHSNRQSDHRANMAPADIAALAHRAQVRNQAGQSNQAQPLNQAQRPSVLDLAAAAERDIFEEALAHATSHMEESPKQTAQEKLRTAKRKGKKHSKVFGIVASVAVFLLLCGFVAYQNKANIQLQLASAKAGFSASVPLYKPEGYSMAKLAYSTGSVATTYNKGNHSFSITQKKSNWDSQTLLENFVATSNEPYQGYESAGRTIYVYGEGKATWVNGGIWYQMTGANNLTNDQIVKVAASM
jgi:hypothetical protein